MNQNEIGITGSSEQHLNGVYPGARHNLKHYKSNSCSVLRTALGLQQTPISKEHLFCKLLTIAAGQTNSWLNSATEKPSHNIGR